MREACSGIHSSRCSLAGCDATYVAELIPRARGCANAGNAVRCVLNCYRCELMPDASDGAGPVRPRFRRALGAAVRVAARDADRACWYVLVDKRRACVLAC